jgi:hypothetical protein
VAGAESVGLFDFGSPQWGGGGPVAIGCVIGRRHYTVNSHEADGFFMGNSSVKGRYLLAGGLLLAFASVAGVYGIWSCYRTYQRSVNQCLSQGKLCELAVLLNDYRFRNGSFPPTSITPDDSPRNSWRTLIARGIEDEVAREFCREYNFGEEWNSSGNRGLTTASWGRHFFSPQEPTASRHHTTSYVAVVGSNGNETVWTSKTDHTRSTKDLGTNILLIEIPDSGIVWTEPRDLPISEAIQMFAAPHGLADPSRTLYYVTVNGDIELLSTIPTVEEFTQKLLVRRNRKTRLDLNDKEGDQMAPSKKPE